MPVVDLWDQKYSKEIEAERRLAELIDEEDSDYTGDSESSEEDDVSEDSDEEDISGSEDESEDLISSDEEEEELFVYLLGQQ